jgi:hypothetical protein
MCALLGYYAAYSCNPLPTLRGKLSVSSSGVTKSKDSWISLLLKVGPIGFPKTSVMNYRYTMHNTPEERTSKECLFPKSSH